MVEGESCSDLRCGVLRSRCSAWRRSRHAPRASPRGASGSALRCPVPPLRSGAHRRARGAPLAAAPIIAWPLRGRSPPGHVVSSAARDPRLERGAGTITCASMSEKLFAMRCRSAAFSSALSARARSTSSSASNRVLPSRSSAPGRWGRGGLSGAAARGQRHQVCHAMTQATEVRVEPEFT